MTEVLTNMPKGIKGFQKGHKLFGGGISKNWKGTVWNKGLKRIHLSKKSEFKKGHIPAHKGKRLSKKAIENIRKGRIESLKNKGENHYNWQGGKSFEPYSVDWNKTLKRSIRERDHYTCRVCKEEGYPVHHIDYDKKNCNPSNLITLCEKCHTKTNFNGENWKIYFTNLIIF